MASFKNVEIDQGLSFTRPPVFHGSNFAHWRKLMEILVNDLDHELWEIIINGDFAQMVKEGDKIMKLRSVFTEEETEKVGKYYRVLNILFCGLNYSEFNCVSTCDTTKEVWDILNTIYEGTTQVRESKISLYVL